MINNYPIGFILGFTHGLFVTYVIFVLRKTRHNRPVIIFDDIKESETGIWLGDADKREWSSGGCVTGEPDGCGSQ